MNNFKTNIVVIPESTRSQNTVGVLVVTIIFIPFFLRFFFENNWLFLGLPIGVVIMALYNLATKGKFLPENWIQKDRFIEFDVSGIKIISRAEEKVYGWDQMQMAHIIINGFDGESRGITEDTPHSGLDNKITFTLNGTTHSLLFYLKNRKQKKEIIQFLRITIFPVHVYRSIND